MYSRRMLNFIKASRRRELLPFIAPLIRASPRLLWGRLGLWIGLSNYFGFPAHKVGRDVIDARGAVIPPVPGWPMVRAAMINADTPLIDYEGNALSRAGAILLSGHPNPVIKINGHIIKGEWGEYGGEWIEWVAVRDAWPPRGSGAILHVGSGAGASAAILKMLGYSVTCIDVEPTTAVIDGEQACDVMILKPFGFNDFGIINDFDWLVMDCEGCEWGLPYPRVPHIVEIHHNPGMLSAFLGMGDEVIYSPDEGVHLVMGWGRR
ncbi:MAG: hypothetical protein ACP5NY_04145 [Thermocladium sp.]